MIFRFILLCLVVGLWGSLVAQDAKEIDSLQKTLQLNLPDTQRVRNLNSLAHLFLYVDNVKSQSYAQEALKKSKAVKYKKGEIKALINLAHSHRNLLNSVRAIEYLYEAYKIAQETQNVDFQLDAYSAIGYEFVIQKNYPKAEDFLTKGLTLAQKHQKKALIANFYGNLSILFSKINQKEKELDYLFKALQIARELDDKLNTSIHLNNLGEWYREQNNLAKAKQYFTEALQISKEINDQEGVMVLFTNLAHLNMAENKIQEAEALCFESIEIAKKINNQFFLKDIYKLLSEIATQKQDFAQALAHYKTYEDLKDKEIDQESQLKIASLQQAYLLEKKEQESEKQKEIQNAIQKQKDDIIKRQSLTIGVVFGSLFIVLILMLLLYRANIHRKKMYLQVNELNSIKDKLFSIIAHDLKSPLNSLEGALHLLQDEQLSPAELQFLMKGLGVKLNDAQNLLENLLNWAKSQMKGIEVKPENIPLAKVVQENIQLVLPTAEKKAIQIQNQVEGHIIIYADLEMTKAVIRNLLNNAIKFTDKGGAIQLFSQVDTPQVGWVQISVKDNGVGIHPEVLPKIFNLKTYYSERGTEQEKGTGLGLMLVKDFVERNQGQIWAESEKGKGSVFSFTLPKASVL
jgi:signal transduction histidine kinase